jgi:hypothetical protein
LTGEPFKQKCADTDEVFEISHDLLVFSTGFEVRNLDGSKTKQNKLLNSNGCIVNENGKSSNRKICFRVVQKRASRRFGPDVAGMLGNLQQHPNSLLE